MRLKSLLFVITFATITVTALAQRGQRGGVPGPPANARQQAAFDLTGYWVSIVTEDWRWRMVTPAKGDYASVPLNNEGRMVADTWDLAKDKTNGLECKAFGAAGIMRMPLRVHITWQDDNTLKVESDAGQQTRLFNFGAGQEQTGERQWQGYSKASWFKQAQSRGLGFGGGGFGGARGGFAGGNLKVVTRNRTLRSGVPRRARSIPRGVEAE
ncbi:MAG: hypothetical protein HYU27_08200 [Acidobacteria bacterium]|nr:hypothetical protein [Acidobacteriota bacterium]